MVVVWMKAGGREQSCSRPSLVDRWRELDQEYDSMFHQDNVSLVEFCERGKSMFWPWRRHVESYLSMQSKRTLRPRITSGGGIVGQDGDLRISHFVYTTYKRVRAQRH